MENQYIQKLLELPEAFRTAYSNREWARAKYIYDTAIRVAEFMGVPEDIKTQLFGSRQEQEPIEGLFPEEMVQDVYERCIFKNHKTYEEESYRRFGQPPQYLHPQPRYPERNRNRFKGG
ncbi:MAG: hypothetical protein IJ335_06455 [Lachnospiraceae bacterium]|nr:hypothetical protein [Lachnospiraceae bacterium]